MKKTTSKNQSANGPDLAAWRQAFQQSDPNGPHCPEPEQVISLALQELPALKRQEVQEHLLTCRECLELYLDVVSAQAEAASPADRRFAVVPDPTMADRLAAVGHKFRETLWAILGPRRLVPALAAVSLVVLVVFLGQERYKLLPPPPVDELRQVSPSLTVSRSPLREEAEVKSQPALPDPGIMAAKPETEIAASFKKSALPAAGAPAEPIRLDVAEVPDNGSRLSYRANRDAFAYLLRLDQKGNLHLIHAGEVDAGKTYYFPAKTPQRQSDAAATPSTIFLIASPAPVTDLEIRLQELDRPGKDELQRLFPQATIRSFVLRQP